MSTMKRNIFVCVLALFMTSLLHAQENVNPALKVVECLHVTPFIVEKKFKLKQDADHYVLPTANGLEPIYVQESYMMNLKNKSNDMQIILSVALAKDGGMKDNTATMQRHLDLAANDVAYKSVETRATEGELFIHTLEQTKAPARIPRAGMYFVSNATSNVFATFRFSFTDDSTGAHVKAEKSVRDKNDLFKQTLSCVKGK